MRQAIFCIAFYIIVSQCFGQSSTLKQLDQINPPKIALAPLLFLASDELMGRATERPEINIAARYISEQFRSFGLKELPATQDFFQIFEIQFISPANAGSFTVGNKTFELGKDLLQASGITISLIAPVVFVDFGSKEDINKADVRGKIVVANMGENDSTAAARGFRFREAKQKLLQEKGAVALIERYRHATSEWESIKNNFLQERIAQPQDTMLPVFLVSDINDIIPSLIESAATAIINVTGNKVRSVRAKNVMGWVEGSDAKLKNQFVVLSGHYDHIGVASKPKMEEGKLDSIYNGARDNAIGATAVIDAARYFALHPAKRSILFISFTAEEIGLIGSKYFAEHPAISLQKLVYNLNIDNASYNDTTIATVVGLGRTSADADIKRACKAYGLTALPDPAPEQELFDRSDNVSLAIKGIPAPTFSLGIRKFDETIESRYHQLSDEVGNFDLKYAMKIINSFILAAKNIANNGEQPSWIKGDKYEAAWKDLYHR